MSNNNKTSKVTPSELVLSAIFFLQQKGGITVKDITKFICQKRGCKQSHVKHEVKRALEKATENGIFSKKRGLYRIESGFGKNKISVKINARNRPKKSKKKESPPRGTPDAGMNPFNEEENETEQKPSDSNYSTKKKFDNPDTNTAEPMIFNTARGNRVSIERIKQAIMGEEDDDDDEDFFEEDEAEEDEDMDFFSDEENINRIDYKPQKNDFVQEEVKEPDVEKKKAKLARKTAKYKSKSKSKSKAKKRKASKPRKKASKRKRAAACRAQRKTDKETLGNDEKKQEGDKGNKEKNPKTEQTQPDTNNGGPKKMIDDFIELNEEDMTEEDPDELSSMLYSKNEGYESDGYLSPNEEILMENLISRDGTVVGKCENSQDSEKSNTEGSTSEKCTHG